MYFTSRTLCNKDTRDTQLCPLGLAASVSHFLSVVYWHMHPVWAVQDMTQLVAVVHTWGREYTGSTDEGLHRHNTLHLHTTCLHVDIISVEDVRE